MLDSDRGLEVYKAVILAAPWHSTSIGLPTEVSLRIPPQPYIHLHVTLFSTTLPSVPSQSFSLPASTKIPPMLLTTFEGARQGGKEPQFNSMSYHGLIRDGEWVVKIFSKKRISDKWLSKTFDGQIGWVHRKEVSIANIVICVSLHLLIIVGRVSCPSADLFVPRCEACPWLLLC